MNSFLRYCGIICSLLSFLWLGACSITPYSTDALEKINWVVKSNNTQTGKLVKERLQGLSAKKGKVYEVDISHEQIRQRTIGVDDAGQPSTYLQEALIMLKVSSKGKAFVNEPIITARELSQQESSKQVSQHKQEMLNELVNDTVLRLNDIANQDKNALLHRYSLYQEFHKHPTPQIASEEE